MLNRAATILIPGLVCAAGAIAQPPLPPGPDGAVTEFAAPADNGAGDRAAPVETNAGLDGDVITLITGKTLSRVQIVKTTPALVYVELAPGVPPLKIRQSQIIDIEYDDIDPNNPAERGETAGHGPGGEVVAEPLAPELNASLGKQVMNTPRSVQARSVRILLANIARELGAALEFSEAVKAVPPAELAWTITIPEGTTLRMLLETDVPRDFPKLRVNYQFDKVVIDVKAAAGA